MCEQLLSECVYACNVTPETAEVHVSPTAASVLHKGNQQHENTRRLWLHEEAPN